VLNLLLGRNLLIDVDTLQSHHRFLLHHLCQVVGSGCVRPFSQIVKTVVKEMAE
jgi:hypothetical protein